MYDLLFRTSAATMLEVAAEPQRLGAQIGFIAILVWSKYSADLHWLMATVNLGRRL
jgi:hypothetical protein